MGLELCAGLCSTAKKPWSTSKRTSTPQTSKQKHITKITLLTLFFFLKIVWFESQNKEHYEEQGQHQDSFPSPTRLNEQFLKL